MVYLVRTSREAETEVGRSEMGWKQKMEAVGLFFLATQKLPFLARSERKLSSKW